MTGIFTITEQLIHSNGRDFSRMCGKFQAPYLWLVFGLFSIRRETDVRASVHQCKYRLVTFLPRSWFMITLKGNWVPLILAVYSSKHWILLVWVLTNLSISASRTPGVFTITEQLMHNNRRDFSYISGTLLLWLVFRCYKQLNFF